VAVTKLKKSDPSSVVNTLSVDVIKRIVQQAPSTARTATAHTGTMARSPFAAVNLPSFLPTNVPLREK